MSARCGKDYKLGRSNALEPSLMNFVKVRTKTTIQNVTDRERAARALHVSKFVSPGNLERIWFDMIHAYEGKDTLWVWRHFRTRAWN